MAMREHREGTVLAQHDGEDAGEGDARCEDVREAPIVNRLDTLRVICDAERRIAGTARIVKLERQRLQIGKEVRAQLHQRLQPHTHEKKIAP